MMMNLERGRRMSLFTEDDLPWPGWSVFCDMGHNSEYLPIFLQEAGYGTYYTGKLVCSIVQVLTTNIDL